MEAPQLIHVNGVRWRVQHGWKDTLLAETGLPLAEWLDRGNATIVKDGEHRTVYRVDLPTAAVYVKHYRCPNFLRRSRHLVRGSSARREWANAIRLAQRSCATAKVVALGERVDGGLVSDSYLITEAIAPSCTLDEALSGGGLSGCHPATIRRRHAVAKALARLAAALHEAGVAPDDFHGGNVLIQFPSANHGSVGMAHQEQAHNETSTLSSDGQQEAAKNHAVRLYLIDIPGVRVRRAPLSRRQTIRNLAMLTSGLMMRTTRAERWRFWREYCERRGGESPWLESPRLERPWFGRGRETRNRIQHFAGEVFSAARQFARSLLAGRDARAFRTNRDFVRRDLPGRRVHAVRDVAEAELRTITAAPESLVADFACLPEKIARESIVVRAKIGGQDGQSIPIAYKRMRPSRFRDRLGQWFSRIIRRPIRSKALRAWRVGHGLMQRGIATARPIFCCTSWNRDSRGEEFLATNWIPRAENLHLFAWRIASMPVDQRDAYAIAAATSLGKLIGRLHWWRIRHRDLKGCNLVLSVSAEADGSFDASAQIAVPAIAVYLIDLDGVRLQRRLSHKTRIRDLARLEVSVSAHGWVGRQARRAFLRAYLAACRPDAIDVKALLHDVRSAADETIREMNRRGKPIA